MTLYDRIRYARQKANLTQDELAQKLGYRDRSTIAKIESGKVDIPHSKVYSFADALNIPSEYLFGFEEKHWEDDIVEDFTNAHSMDEKAEIVQQNGIDPRYAYEYYLEKHDHDITFQKKGSPQDAQIDKALTRELFSLFSRLSKDQQQSVIDYLRFLLSKS